MLLLTDVLTTIDNPCLLAIFLLFPNCVGNNMQRGYSSMPYSVLSTRNHAITKKRRRVIFKIFRVWLRIVVDASVDPIVYSDNGSPTNSCASVSSRMMSNGARRLSLYSLLQ
ncbi:hypothetical protein IW262DRAFT_1420417 [Armillaria fumosa]|nr:hypothetical protein IW262DRAFT_1420417 [Armillaria fumosa]